MMSVPEVTVTRWLVLALTVAALLVPDAAFAKKKKKQQQVKFAARVHAGLPDYVGVDASAFRPKMFHAQIGGSGMVYANTVFLRAGPSTVISGKVKKGAYITVAPMVGYRYWQLVEDGTTGHAGTATVALDLVNADKRGGFDVQLQGGVDYWLTADAQSGITPEASLGVGLVF